MEYNPTRPGIDDLDTPEARDLRRARSKLWAMRRLAAHKRKHMKQKQQPVATGSSRAAKRAEECGVGTVDKLNDVLGDSIADVLNGRLDNTTTRTIATVGGVMVRAKVAEVMYGDGKPMVLGTSAATPADDAKRREIEAAEREEAELTARLEAARERKVALLNGVK